MNAPSFINVAAHLPEMARQRPYQLAVICPAGKDRAGLVRYVHWTARTLDAESDLLAHGLNALGIRRGVRTVLMVKPSLEFFALTFALFKIGAVPVLVDPGMGVRNLGQCLREAEPEAFIGVAKAHLARWLFGWARRTVRITVTVGRGPFWGAHHYYGVMQEGAFASKLQPYPLAEVSADETAAILFTSGSTGVPKGAVYTHGIFAAQVELLRQTYHIEPGEIDLCTFPLFALFAPALGMTAVVPDMDATRPGRVHAPNIFTAVQDWGVTNLFGSPALLRRLCEDSFPERMPSLRRVISAGAPVPADVLDGITKLLAPGVQVFTPYGATESLPVCNIGSDEILNDTRHRTAEGAGVCVGQPVNGMTVKVIRISDDPLPDWSEELLLPLGEIGEIVVQGPVVTREYYHRPEQTALAKISEPASGRFWHRMGDLGYFDDQGRLWFCGRKSHRVITEHGTLYTIPCEAVFNQQAAVFRTALVGVGPRGKSRPIICVELRKDVGRLDPELLTDDFLELAQSRPHTRGIDTFLIHPAFPVDVRHNSKIFREKLAAWAARRLR